MAKVYLRIPVKEMLPGDDVEGFFLLNNANVKTAANGSQFLSCKLGDKDAEIEAKVWDYQADIHEHVGSVVKVRGNVSEYNGVKQIVVDRIRLAETSDGYELSDLVPCAPINLDETANNLRDILGTIYDDDYRKIAYKVYERMGSQLKTLPAAKSMHHAFLGGWLMHTYNMMQMALATANVYGPIINIDLLLCGTFCHDMAKRFEFNMSEIGLVNDYSVEGALLGHLVMGAEEITEIANELGISPRSEKIMLLKHMLLSHHGEPEFGAAVRPYTLEAEILHHLDMLDARIESIVEELSKTDPGAMTDRVRALGHPVYNHD